MEKVNKVHFDVWNYNVHIVYTDNINRSRNARLEELGSRVDLPSSVDGLHTYNKKEFDAYLFFTPESSNGVIAHECFHAVSRMLKFFGAKLEEETTAYHLTYLVDKCHELKEAKNDKRKRSKGDK